MAFLQVIIIQNSVTIFINTQKHMNNYQIGIYNYNLKYALIKGK